MRNALPPQAATPCPSGRCPVLGAGSRRALASRRTSRTAFPSSSIATPRHLTRTRRHRRRDRRSRRSTWCSPTTLTRAAKPRAATMSPPSPTSCGQSAAQPPCMVQDSRTPTISSTDTSTSSSHWRVMSNQTLLLFATPSRLQQQDMMISRVFLVGGRSRRPVARWRRPCEERQLHLDDPVLDCLSLPQL